MSHLIFKKVIKKAMREIAKTGRDQTKEIESDVLNGMILLD